MKLISGPLLRRLGLLIEFACLLGFVAARGGGREVAGFPLAQVLLAGVALGCVLWAAGMVWIWAVPREAGGAPGRR